MSSTLNVKERILTIRLAKTQGENVLAKGERDIDVALIKH